MYVLVYRYVRMASIVYIGDIQYACFVHGLSSYAARPEIQVPLGLDCQELSDTTPWEVPEIEPMEPVRSTDLADLWSPLGVTWVEHNRCVVPGNFPQEQITGDTLEAYAHTRSAASLFDVSFKDASIYSLFTACFSHFKWTRAPLRC